MKLTVAKWNQKEDSTYSEDGLIRINTDKPEYGSLMLVAVVTSINNGFINKRNKVGFISGEVTQLEEIITEYNLKEGGDYSELVSPHKIVTLEKVESEVPEDKNGGKSGYKEKINPSTDEILSKDGEPIYWKNVIVEEGVDIENELILHDVGPTVDEAINEFQKEAEKVEKK
jgi:hypothetical protein